MRAMLAFLLLLLAPPLNGADVLPSAGKAVGIIRDDTPGSWAVVAQDFSPVEVKEFDGDEAKGWLGCYFEGPSGRYLAIKSGGNKLKTFAVVLGAVGPTPIPPPGPIPPPPIPPPVPPPTPTPVPGPIKVLILEESDDRRDGKYTRGQVEAMTSATVRQYIDSHASKGSTGPFPDYMLADDDETLASLKAGGLSAWSDVYVQACIDCGANGAKTAEPFLVIQREGKTVYSGQITTMADTLAILKKWGGP